MSDALQFTAQCNKASVPVLNQPQLIYLLTELLPGTAMANTRMPLNFALVLDRSGSMEGDKLRAVKMAVKNIIDLLEPADVISIVTFEQNTQVLIPAQAVTDKNGLKRKVDSLDTGGATNMAPALRAGLDQVSRFHAPDRVSRLVLLTDGEATDELDDSRRESDSAGARGIPLIGLGFGNDWKEDFIIDLANRSVLAQPGSKAYVDFIASPEQANAIFQEVFRSMQVVAQNVQITHRMVQGIEARRVWQVTPMIKDIGLTAIQGRSIVIPVGDLEKGGMAYLVEMMLPPRPAGNVRVAQTEVSYAVPGRGMQKEAADLILNFTYDAAQAGQVNGKVMNVVERVQAFKLQTQALDEAAVNPRGATQKLRQAVTILLSQGETELAQQMEKEAQNLEQGGQISSEGKKTIKLTARKTIKLTDP
jgi:Ca-activated chloride channel family protein